MAEMKSLNVMRNAGSAAHNQWRNNQRNVQWRNTINVAWLHQAIMAGNKWQ